MAEISRRSFVVGVGAAVVAPLVPAIAEPPCFELLRVGLPTIKFRGINSGMQVVPIFTAGFFVPDFQARSALALP